MYEVELLGCVFPFQHLYSQLCSVSVFLHHLLERVCSKTCGPVALAFTMEALSELPRIPAWDQDSIKSIRLVRLGFVFISFTLWNLFHYFGLRLFQAVEYRRKMENFDTHKVELNQNCWILKHLADCLTMWCATFLLSAAHSVSHLW